MNREVGPFPLPALNTDCSVMPFDDLIGDIQSKPGAFVSLMAVGIIGVKYPVKILGRNSVACIRNMDRDPARNLFRPYSYTSAVRRIDSGIVHDVLKRLPQIKLISLKVKIVRNLKL